MLAVTMRRWDDAVRHFEDALAVHERMAAPAWVARTRCDYAALLGRVKAEGRAFGRGMTAEPLVPRSWRWAGPGRLR